MKTILAQLKSSFVLSWEINFNFRSLLQGLIMEHFPFVFSQLQGDSIRFLRTAANPPRQVTAPHYFQIKYLFFVFFLCVISLFYCFVFVSICYPPGGRFRVGAAYCHRRLRRCGIDATPFCFCLPFLLLHLLLLFLLLLSTPTGIMPSFGEATWSSFEGRFFFLFAGGGFIGLLSLIYLFLFFLFFLLSFLLGFSWTISSGKGNAYCDWLLFDGSIANQVGRRTGRVLLQSWVIELNRDIIARYSVQ